MPLFDLLMISKKMSISIFKTGIWNVSTSQLGERDGKPSLLRNSILVIYRLSKTRLKSLASITVPTIEQICIEKFHLLSIVFIPNVLRQKLYFLTIHISSSNSLNFTNLHSPKSQLCPYMMASFVCILFVFPLFSLRNQVLFVRDLFYIIGELKATNSPLIYLKLLEILIY